MTSFFFCMKIQKLFNIFLNFRIHWRVLCWYASNSVHCYVNTRGLVCQRQCTRQSDVDDRRRLFLSTRHRIDRLTSAEFTLVYGRLQHMSTGISDRILVKDGRLFRTIVVYFLWTSSYLSTLT